MISTDSAPSWNRSTACIAFEGPRRIAAGKLADVARSVRRVLDRGPRGPVLILDDATSEQIEVDFSGAPEHVIDRLPALPTRADRANPEISDTARGPGRPKLGVIAREVTLLPRHWDWLAAQPGGASVAIRKLVEEARHRLAPQDRIRAVQESAYRFLSTMAGNLPGFEEAIRALFGNQSRQFKQLTAQWPASIREHAQVLAERVFEATSSARLVQQ